MKCTVLITKYHPMVFKAITLIRNIKLLVPSKESKVIEKVKKIRRENKLREGITLRITKKFMDLSLDLLTIKIKQENGQ